MLSFDHSSLMPIVQNEPNLEGPAGAPSVPRETKPISAGALARANRATTPRCPVSFRQQTQFLAVPGGTRDKCAKRSQFQAGPSGPVSTLRPRLRRERSSKQSQTWASWRIWGTARGGSPLCKTNPIPARPGSTRPGGRGTNVRNKANCPKRGTTAVSRRRQAGRGPRGVGRGANAQNEPNSRVRHARGLRCKTKPIPWRSSAGRGTMAVR